MSHYSDDALAAYVTDPSGAAEGKEMEQHLAGCPDCRARVATLEKMEDALRDRAVWNQVDGFLARPRRMQEALKLKASIEKENADAVRMLAPLLASPLRFGEARLDENPRFRTAGVVRMLCAEASGMHEKRPRYSLQLADAACAIAAALPAGTPAARLSHGFALRERANALRYLGRFGEALAALDEAEPRFDGSPAGDPFDLAIARYIRGSVLVQMERAADALPLARAAAEVFRDYGDERRELSALLLEGACLHTVTRHAEALETFERVIALARQLNDRGLLADALEGAAVASTDLQALDQAERYYAEALVLYDDLGLTAQKARTEWSIAGLVMARGDLEAAERILDSARIELQRLGLRNDHALATLEWAEVRLALKRAEGVAKACREILIQFNSEGMMRKARLALAYFHQALARNDATPQLARQVRTYLERLPHDPAAVFSPQL